MNTKIKKDNLFDAEEIYNFFSNNGLDHKAGVTAVHNFYYGYKIERLKKYTDSNKQYLNILNVKEVEEIIENKNWNFHNIEKPKLSLIPFPPKSPMIGNLSYKTKKEFKLYYNYFDKKGIDLLNHIQQYSLKYDISKDMARHNVHLFHAINFLDYDITTKERINSFKELMSAIVPVEIREFQMNILLTINLFLNKYDEREQALNWFAIFIKNHKTVGQKALPIFDELKEKFTPQELKSKLTSAEYNEMVDSDDDGLTEKKAEATRFRMDLTKLKLKTGIPTPILKDNIRKLIRIVPELLKENEDFVDIKTEDTKQEIIVQILYEKNGTGETLKIMKALLKECISINKSYPYRSEELENHLKEFKNKLVFSLSLENKLEEKETKQHRIKI